MWLAGPMTVAIAPAVSQGEVAENLSRDLVSTQQFGSERQQRLQLACRWFRRGHEAKSQVDKYLYWWTVLEIYPGKGRRKIVNIIADFLNHKVFPDLTSPELKEKLYIGRMYNLRGEIVHKGRAFVSTDDIQFKEYLDRLNAVVTVSLRLLAGLGPGDELCKFLDS